MNDKEEFAPEYSKRERIRLLVKYLLIFAPLIATTQWWFFPWFDEYIKIAHCLHYGEFTGTHLVFYGLFIGIPATFLLFLFFTEGVRNIRIFRKEQHPLPDEKVFRPTKYTYGRVAKLKTLPIFFVLAALFGFCIYGFSAANNIIAMVEEKELSCINS